MTKGKIMLFQVQRNLWMFQKLPDQTWSVSSHSESFQIDFQDVNRWDFSPVRFLTVRGSKLPSSKVKKYYLGFSVICTWASSFLMTIYFYFVSMYCVGSYCMYVYSGVTITDVLLSEAIWALFAVKSWNIKLDEIELINRCKVSFTENFYFNFKHMIKLQTVAACTNRKPGTTPTGSTGSALTGPTGF